MERELELLDNIGKADKNFFKLSPKVRSARSQ